MYIASFETTIDVTDATVWVITPTGYEQAQQLGDIEVVVSGYISKPEADDDITPGERGSAEVHSTETIIDGKLRTIELPYALDELVAERLYGHWEEWGDFA